MIPRRRRPRSSDFEGAVESAAPVPSTIVRLAEIGRQSKGRESPDLGLQTHVLKRTGDGVDHRGISGATGDVWFRAQEIMPGSQTGCGGRGDHGLKEILRLLGNGSGSRGDHDGRSQRGNGSRDAGRSSESGS